MIVKKEYNQLPGESYPEWRSRVLSHVATKEYDLSWEHACMLLGMEMNPERARKMGEEIVAKKISVKKIEDAEDLAYEELLESEDSNLDKENKALIRKEIRLQKEKVKVNDIKRETNAKIRDRARFEVLLGALTDAILENNIVPVFDKDESELLKASLSDRENEGILLLSDWHKGMVCANLHNIFNDEVFDRRVQELVDKTILYGEYHKIKKLHVFALGDLVHGLIHINARIESNTDVAEQTSGIIIKLIQVLRALSKHFELFVYFSRGNHDRIEKNKKESIDKESFFDIIKSMVKYIIKDTGGDDVIHVMPNKLDPEIIRAEVLGNVCYAVHGHKEKTKSVAKDLASFTREIPDYIFMGHYHAAMEINDNDTEVIVNGSLCGSDSFAISIRRTSRPSQKFMVFNKDGRLCTYNIMLPVEKAEAE